MIVFVTEKNTILSKSLYGLVQYTCTCGDLLLAIKQQKSLAFNIIMGLKFLEQSIK